MRIFFESPERLKIELDETDMTDLDITYDELDYSSDKTRRIIDELLARIGAEREFSLRPGKKLIEIFPSDAGGCIIYFTAVRHSAAVRRIAGRRDACAVWEVRSADDLLQAAAQLKRAGFTRPIRLYRLNNRYRLTASPETKQEEMLLSEFAQRIHGAAASLYTAEHGTLLSGDLIADFRS